MSRPSRKALSPAPAAKTSPVRNLGKITAPTLQRIFGNERLFARLDAARFYPVVWVHGPPGAGKTTLAASYLTARGVKPLWCRLDEGDSDPASIFLHLAAGADLRAPGLDLPLLQPEFRTALPLFARRFFRNLFATDGVPVVVLDDYHEIAAGAEFHDCLPAGLEEVPSGCQVIVISRSAPPSQLARLRLNGRIDVIEPDALRLNQQEIRALARERGADAPDLAEDRIVSATQGWAAGVILMLEASASGPVQTQAEMVPVPEVLFDYFAGEVVQRMEAWVPAVLSTLALMPTMTAAMAERLTAEPEAGALLEDLHRRNYFTTRDSAAEPRYRFHPLFRDFLRSRSRRQGSAADDTLLKVRAAAVLDEDGQVDAAVQLLAETAQTETLAGLIKRRAAALVEEGRNDTLSAWLAKLGDEQIAADGWLSYWRGAARIAFDPKDAYRHHQKALVHFELAEDVFGQFVAWIGVSEAVRLDAFGDMSRFDPLIAKMHALRARYPEFPSPSIELGVCTAMATALSRRSSDRSEYFAWADRARSIASAVGTPSLVIRFGYAFTIMDLLDGRFDASRDALKTLPDPFTLDHLPLAQWAGLLAHAMALLHKQQPGDLEAFAIKALQRLDQSGITFWMPMVAIYVGIMAWGREDAALCEIWRSRSAAYAERAGIGLGPIYYVVTAGHRLLLGDMTGAKAEADRGLSEALKRGWMFFVAQTRYMRALTMFAAKELDEALSELDRADEEIDRSMSDSLRFPAKLLRADLAFALGNEPAAETALCEAMAFGRCHGAAFVPMMTQTAAAGLCKRALSLGIERDFVLRIIRADCLASPDPFDEAWPWPIRITTLGGLAIEVDGAPLAFSGKTPRRLLALVKAIAAYGGCAVPEAKIADAVWPEEEADAAFNSLNIAIHRLRKLLGDANAITVSNATIGFDPARCWLDIWTLEHLATRGSADDAAVPACDRLLGLYNGDFLTGDEDLPFTTQPREQWRRRFARAVRAAAESGSVPIPIYERALTAAPTSDELCQGLMQCHLGLGRPADGIAAYERLREALEERTGARPAPASDALYRKLLAV